MEEFDSNNIEDINTSMFIEASAGTGKTYTITKIIKKLLSQGIKLDELLVTAFISLLNTILYCSSIFNPH